MKIDSKGVGAKRIGSLADGKRLIERGLYFGRGAGGFVVHDHSAQFAGFNNRTTLLSVRSDDFKLGEQFSIQFWFRFEGSVPGIHAIINKENSYEIGIDQDGKIKTAVYVGGWSWKDSGVTLIKGRWYHITWRWDGSNNKNAILLNGDLVAYYDGDAGGTPNANDLPLRIGGRGSVSDIPTKADFSIADLRIYNELINQKMDIFRPLTTDEITASNSLVGYWYLAGPGDYQDKSGNGNDFVEVNTASDPDYPYGLPVLDGGAVFGGIVYTRSPASCFSFHPLEGPNGEDVVGFWDKDILPHGQTSYYEWENGFYRPGFEKPFPDTYYNWDRKLNGELYHVADIGWVGYNSGVSSPQVGYHAHYDPSDGLLGSGSYVLPNENEQFGLAKRWLGVRQNVSSFITSDLAKDGNPLTISFYVKATNSDMRVKFGLYHYNPSDQTYNFKTSSDADDGLYVSDPIGVVDEWVRVEKTWHLDENYIDGSQDSYVYIYGYDNPEGRMWITLPQIEYSEYATGYSHHSRPYAGWPIPSSPWKESTLQHPPVSLAFWFKKKGVSPIGDAGYVFYAYKSNTPPYQVLSIRSNANNTLSFRVVDADNNSWEVSTAAIPLGEWHHIAAVVDENRYLRLYLDGQLIGSDGPIDEANWAPNYFDSLQIGAIGDSSHGGLNGTLYDFVLVPDAALTHEEILALYELGRPRDSISYDGTSLMVNGPVVEGRSRFDLSRWTVLDLDRRLLLGKYGRGLTEWVNGHLLPYGPWGNSVWLGRPISRLSGDWLYGTFHGWHSDIGDNIVYASQNGRWLRMPIDNPITGTTYTEFLTYSNIRPLTHNTDYVMQFLYRSDGDGDGFKVGNVSFYTANGHHSLPVNNVYLGNKTYLAWATWTSGTDDGSARAIDILNNFTRNNATYIEIADGMFFIGTTPNAYTRGGIHKTPWAGRIVFGTANSILGEERVGTLVMLVNPSTGKPARIDPTIFHAGEHLTRGDCPAKDNFRILWTNDEYSDNGGTGHGLRISVCSSDNDSGSPLVDGAIKKPFYPWTWYIVVVRWGGGSVIMEAYTLSGELYGRYTATYDDTKWPEYSSGSMVWLGSGVEGGADTTAMAILGTLALSREKINDAERDDIVRRFGNGVATYDGRSLYIVGSEGLREDE